MQAAKEKVKDGLSAVKAKTKITQGKASEKAEAATARSHAEREPANERGKAKLYDLECYNDELSKSFA
uniref:Uncharacterized protein n=1 Tax=Aegilops tauschii TaxID=37682 RepID=M8BGA3_AEGTA